MAIIGFDYTTSLCELLESVICENKDWLEKFSTNSKLQDFKENDIVKCTYYKGFYKIVKLENTRISICPMENDEILTVAPKFLKKIEVNEKLLKVLYGNTGFSSR